MFACLDSSEEKRTSRANEDYFHLIVQAFCPGKSQIGRCCDMLYCDALRTVFGNSLTLPDRITEEWKQIQTKGLCIT